MQNMTKNGRACLCCSRCCGAAALSARPWARGRSRPVQRRRPASLPNAMLSLQPIEAAYDVVVSPKLASDEVSVRARIAAEAEVGRADNARGVAPA